MTEFLNLPKYKCHKIVGAAKIVGIFNDEDKIILVLMAGKVGLLQWPESLAWAKRNTPRSGGYLVAEEDGYTSYRPAEAFEAGYAPCVDGEPASLSAVGQAVAGLDRGEDIPEQLLGAALEEVQEELSAEAGNAVTEETIFPRRRIEISVEHPTVGDDYFAPKVNQALLEWMGKYPTGDAGCEDFTASNGTHIHVNQPPMNTLDLNEIERVPYREGARPQLNWNISSNGEAAIQGGVFRDQEEPPTVTPAHIEDIIVSERFFTAKDGAFSPNALCKYKKTIGLAESARVSESLGLLTFCVLVLHNGFTVVGKSACAAPERFDAALGRKFAREDAINQVWAFEGYLLKERLHQGAE